MKASEYLSVLDIGSVNGLISDSKFNKLFHVQPVGDDGNCFFYAIETVISNFDEYRIHNHITLRSALCKYYKSFSGAAAYPDNSLKYKIQLHLLYDNVETDGKLHTDNICKDRKWASLMDVMAMTDLLKINIVVLNRNIKKKAYTYQEFIYSNSEATKTVFIRFNGRDHFEPLFPLFDKDFWANSISSSSETKRSNSNSKSKRSRTRSKSKSISEETKRMIQNAENLSKAKSISSETRRAIQNAHKSKSKSVSEETKRMIQNAENLSKAKSISSETKRLISQLVK